MKSMSSIKGCALTLLDPVLKRKKKRTELRIDFDVEDTVLTLQTDITDKKIADELYFHDLHFSDWKEKSKEANDCALPKSSTNTICELCDENKNQIITRTDENNDSENSSDYSYDDLLTRVFDIMKSFEQDDKSKQKLILAPLRIVHSGKRRTSFINFGETCKSLRRTPKHLMAFLLADLNTSGTIDSTGRLVLKGGFLSKQIENLVNRYMEEYVLCHACRSLDTRLVREARLYFVVCDSCTSKSSVANLKCGFQAVRTPRKLQPLT